MNLDHSRPMFAPAWRRPAVISLAASAALVLVGAALAWGYFLPRAAEGLVREQLDKVESRTGLRVTTGPIELAGWRGVSIRDVRLQNPEGGEQPILSIKMVEVGLNKALLLRGQRVISRLAIEDATLHVHRFEDGRVNLVEEARQIRERLPRDDREEEEDGGEEASPRWLRRFGGQWPEVVVQNAKVVFTEAPVPGEPAFWPVTTWEVVRANLDSDGDEAALTVESRLDRGAGLGTWTFPTSANVTATLRLPLERSSAALSFEPALEAKGPAGFPFLTVGLAGVELDAEQTLHAREFKLAVTGRDGLAEDEVRLAAASASFANFPAPLSELRLLSLSADGVEAKVVIQEDGASILQTGNEVLRAPKALHVVARAREIAESVAGTQAATKPAAPPAPDWARILSERAPQRVYIQNTRITVEDRRAHRDLTAAARRLEISDARLGLAHQVIGSELSLEAGAQLHVEGTSRGKVDVQLSSNYRTGALKVLLEVDALDAAVASQLAGDAISSKIQGGVGRVKLRYESPGKDRVAAFSGLLSLENGHVVLAPLAEGPITPLTTSYTFEGTWDPRAPIPATRLGKMTGSTAETNPEMDEALNALSVSSSLPMRGALVIQKGQARVNGVTAEFRPAIYGLDGLTRRPNRLDLHVDLPTTSLEDLTRAVPAAIKGPLADAQFRGTFRWRYDVEIPLYRARDMAWRADTELADFEIVHLPPAVDVRKLTQSFEHTIRDDFTRNQRPVTFQRTVRIPEMRPVPAQWLVDNAGLTANGMDKERRIPRQEMPRPGTGTQSAGHGENEMLGSVHLHEGAPRPWDDQADATANAVVPAQQGGGAEFYYGSYVYAPLQHTSPWLTRAILTTEDGGFFNHRGFNWLSLRGSLEANLNAGRYVRGGSTISMQLVKNLYLARSKVLARKLQEAFLVWLMEDVVDVPKERLLELYLNIIEFGPGIFGIHDAAVHYFGKRPDALTLAEVSWLVSIVPNPKRYHAYYDRGELNEVWLKRMRRYVKAMETRGRVSAEDAALAMVEVPRFYKRKSGEPLFRTGMAVTSESEVADDEMFLGDP